MRLFAAIRPPQDILEHLDSALEDVRARAGRALRFTDMEQQHLTLAFHPDIPDGALEDALDEMAQLAAGFDPLTLHLAGAGEFSGRTLWIGAGGDAAGMERLLAQPWLGESPRERRRAHLTVARVSARAPQARRAPRQKGQPRESAPAHILLQEAVHALSVYRGPEWTAREVELVASRLGEGRSGGPLHEIVGMVPLGTW
ncbi:2'-5' RNA ligase family protein [Brachybacterium sp. JHP9]|uniref:RNA 2',3'-cyclic phosphodiesterase n=1 Tax=Brachybacterium equifaecis TaxID=2910770 RepID=A0ABT0R159_9MICO|nr:2'-5' RNA ligase family protein [Brachybacterium equifaecis]MCL6423626.1 2'-5' RNA ligase family protein [Brachybacterium equifaecis]